MTKSFGDDLIKKCQVTDLENLHRNGLCPLYKYCLIHQGILCAVAKNDSEICEEVNYYLPLMQIYDPD